MTNSNQQGGLSAAIKRRPVGKGAWKMTLQEIIESERTSLQDLRAIGNRHPHDAETQRYIANAMYEAADRVMKLTQLLQYKEPDNGGAE